MTKSVGADDGGEALREEAAGWVARRARGLSPREQQQFERWLADDPEHAAIYQRISQRFAGARVLRSSIRYRQRSRHRRAVTPIIAIIVAATATIMMFVVVTARRPQTISNPVEDPQVRIAGRDANLGGRQIAAREQEIRTAGLEDGSLVTVDHASTVSVDFRAGMRRITLSQGRARFTVAHDGRPFVVFAGGGAIIAKGTVFDVALTSDGNVLVHLVRGIVEVAPQTALPRDTGLNARRLSVGQQVTFSRGHFTAPVFVAEGEDLRWDDDASDFDDVPLAHLLDQANRLSGHPIRVVDPALGRLKISGRFQVQDSARLATNLASLFDLRVVREPSAIVLRRD